LLLLLLLLPPPLHGSVSFAAALSDCLLLEQFVCRRGHLWLHLLLTQPLVGSSG
jgi:hypothetical protein